MPMQYLRQLNKDRTPKPKPPHQFKRLKHIRDVRPQKRRRVSNSESKDVVKVVKKYEVDLKDIGSKILMPDLDTPQTPGGHVNSQPDFSDIAKRQMHLVETVKKE
eukprot:915382_1